MNLRKKLTIIILSAFVLNVTFLIGYYELSLSEKLAMQLNVMQLELDSKLDDIAKVIDANNDINRISDISNNTEELNEFCIYIEDSYGNIVYEKDNYNQISLNLTSVKMINIEGEVYMIKLINPLKIKSIIEIPVIKKLLKSEIIIIGIILLVLTTIIYIKIIKPILYLQTDINNYKYGIKPIRTNRCDEIGWLKNNFVELTEKIDYEKEKKNRMIASISHDIKTPLTSIMGYSERLKNKDILKERRDRYIEIIYSKSQNIKELIDEFDDYLSYNLESSIKKQQITIKKLANIVKEEYQYELNHIGIDFYIESDCYEDIINIDKSKIRRVFGNIIGNSIKHMENEDKRIEVYFKDKGESIEVSISDNGSGVGERDLDKIFEALYTSDKSRKVAGLGLSICKSAIEGHGGRIWAENNAYGGLTIKFTLSKVNLKSIYKFV